MGKNHIETLINLENFPILERGSEKYIELVTHCKSALEQQGMFSLNGFLKAESCKKAVQEIQPIMEADSFEHRRSHNIYFLNSIVGLEPSHPALRKVETVNHTVCADQIRNSIIMEIYNYTPLLHFLSDVMEKPELFLMEDPLAKVNVMSYRHGESLNWHFDRSEFTTTLLLQEPNAGGIFEYRKDLRAENAPNYAGVAELLNGNDSKKQDLELSAGTLNVFKGKNTAHRVTAIEGEKERMIAVFSYYEFAGKVFSDQERLGFYGRKN